MDRASLRALADEISPAVVHELERFNAAALQGGGEVLDRGPGEMTWTLQIQVVGLRVAIMAKEHPRFWVAYFGPPNGDSAPAAITDTLDTSELAEALAHVMREVVRDGGR